MKTRSSKDDSGGVSSSTVSTLPVPEHQCEAFCEHEVRFEGLYKNAVTKTIQICGLDVTCDEYSAFILVLT